jgi:histidinol dehydrogenase
MKCNDLSLIVGPGRAFAQAAKEHCAAFVDKRKPTYTGS